ncbi:hypothetical protein [Paenibacillus piscarius]|uniref:hypothetical protein n=1 Tax=Paenibacillus piscarius TaxID=1089681 RepID=UPI001EE806F2|nr:hypothetical protein [Paenibacillus piscarius]
MLSSLKNTELRDLCRTTIETLEIWLRRLIDQQLREDFGVNYLQYKDNAGNFLMKRSVREGVIRRRSTEPKRYPRDIDAVLLDDSVSILLNPILYKKYFRAALISAFPIGTDMAKVIFDKIIEPRNYLAHGNHISVRQAEQILCYSHDIIDSIKGYYVQIGVGRLFNVPSIIQVSDSLGNIKYESEISEVRNDVCIPFIFNQPNNPTLRPGDELSIEVEIDSTFQEDQYTIQWRIEGQMPSMHQITNKFFIKIDNSHVGERFVINCFVTSNKDWHRYGSHDDCLILLYKVLPPI